MKHFIIFILALLSVHANAQKETANWFFGTQAGLDFNSGAPVVVNTGQINTTEGCSSISDANGNLLMYTDGNTIWDRTHNIMPNGSGLLGDPSSAQSGIIVPKPNDPNTYYVFTAAVEGSVSGMNYSEVKLNLNGGNGDVTANKNIFLIGPSSEKITAVKHGNGTDIWVVTQTDLTNQYYAFLVTAAGVSTTPVMTAIGTANSSGGADGYLKFSPDGTKLANAYLYNGLFELFDFNASTGQISNTISMMVPGLMGMSYEPYGLEFSPNSQLIYVGTGSELSQFNLSIWTQASILASKVDLIANPSFLTVPYALQLALDGKIYVAYFSSSLIGYINDPNTQGLGCDFINGGISVAPAMSQAGLPQFITSYFLTSSITSFDFCVGDTTFFTSQVNPSPDSVLWDFGIAGTSLDTSTILDPYFIYPDTGEYIVTLYSWLNSVKDTAIDTIHIYGKFLVPIADEPICNNGTALIDATHPLATYLWIDGSTNPTMTVDTPGIYWVDITQNGCTVRDSIESVLVVLTFSLGNDTTLCPKTSVTKTLSLPLATYLWNTGSTSSSISISDSGTYWVDVLVKGCIQRDSIIVTYFPDPLFIGNDTILCFDTASVTLYSNMSSLAYLWNTGATTSSIIAHPDSIYSIQILDANNCLLQDSVHVSYNTPSIFLGDDIIACLGEDFILNVEKPEFVDYQWNDGKSYPLISINKSGEYWVHIKDNNGCYASDTIHFNFDGCSLFIPNAFTPDGTQTNNIFKAYGENITDFSIEIFNRWGESIFKTNDLASSWNGKWKNQPAPMGVYTYAVEYRNTIDLKTQKRTGFVTLIR